MKHQNQSAAIALACLAILASDVGAQDWITTWAASPQPRLADGFVVQNITPLTLTDRTIRQVVRVSIGGRQVRVVLSNEYGHRPLAVGAAAVARPAGAGAIVPGSGVPLTFAGHPEIEIPPGARLVSDPVAFDLEALDSLAVSLHLPEEARIDTFHLEGVQTAYISGPGRFVEATRFEPSAESTARLLLSGVMVDATPSARAIVFFGDSITDGNCSTVNANLRYPDLVAQRLQAAGHTNVAVINAGISGARVLRNGMGDNALARLDRDVLAQPHVDTMVMMLGLNDIGWAQTVLDGTPVPSAEAITAMYRMVIDRAHSHGIRVLGATLTPFADSFESLAMFNAYYSPAKEEVRQAVNEWIRTSGAFDGVVDFDAVLQDPDRPGYLLDAYDCGDNLHPNDAGYEVMANAVDLDLLLGP